METQLIPQSVVITVTIEQEGFSKTSTYRPLSIPNTGQLANIVLNLAFSELSVNRLVSATDDKVKLSKPFTFAIAIECGDKSLLIPDFTTKMSLSEKGVEKLVKNLPQIILLTTMDYTIPVSERIKALREAEHEKLVLS